MSRSYRKPYATYCSNGSAAVDKKMARRGWRRAQNQTLDAAMKQNYDWDEVLLPARYEAAHNDVWCWGRDGKQFLHTYPTHRQMTLQGLTEDEVDGGILSWSWRYYQRPGADEWFKKLQRK